MDKTGLKKDASKTSLKKDASKKSTKIQKNKIIKKIILGGALGDGTHIIQNMDSLIFYLNTVLKETKCNIIHKTNITNIKNINFYNLPVNFIVLFNKLNKQLMMNMLGIYFNKFNYIPNLNNGTIGIDNYNKFFDYINKGDYNKIFGIYEIETKQYVIYNNNLRVNPFGAIVIKTLEYLNNNNTFKVYLNKFFETYTIEF